VRHGLWLIVARSATVMQAEAGGLDKEERESVLAASRYADAHWRPTEEVQIEVHRP
jgi:hypothetical protein